MVCFFFFWLSAKAKELAGKVGGEAITLCELENFHPEEGMILANCTPVGMKPNIDVTPIRKVNLELPLHFLLILMAKVHIHQQYSLGVSMLLLFIEHLLLVHLHCLFWNMLLVLFNSESKIEHKFQLGKKRIKGSALQFTA